MTRNLHIIASCTDRKREDVPNELRLRAVPGAEPEPRVARWWARLTDHRHLTFEAQNLYAGEHWSVVQELPDVARRAGLRPHLWVASAGYGLIRAAAAIRPYSATFARAQPDSVVVDASDRNSSSLRKRWWSAIARQSGPDDHAPRTVEELARLEPSASILVVASPLYVSAMEDDLARAAGALRSSDNLLVVSTPSPLSRGVLASNWVPSTAHLQAHVGGSRLALHARVARNILEEAPRKSLLASEVRERYRQLIQRSDALVRYDRMPMTDKAVRDFILAAETRASAKSWSAALRLLRLRGFACEQSRFKQIYLSLEERA